MQKRLRRDKRTILVEDMETANGIRDYCMSNLMDYLDTTIWGTVYVFKNPIDRYAKVIFRCTAEEWARVMDHYDLVKSERYSHGKDRMTIYEYKLKA